MWQLVLTDVVPKLVCRVCNRSEGILIRQWASPLRQSALSPLKREPFGRQIGQVMLIGGKCKMRHMGKAYGALGKAFGAGIYCFYVYVCSVDQ